MDGRFGGMRATLGAFLMLAPLGCGGQPAPPRDLATAETTPQPPQAQPAAAPAAAGAKVTPAAARSQAAKMERGSAEWLLHEVTLLTARPLIPVGGDADVQPVPDERLAVAEKRRQHEIIQLSLEAIAKTHEDPAQEQLFNNAVHYLTDAHLKLALRGDDAAAAELVEHVEALYERDPKSFAAVESADKLVRLAREKAEAAPQSQRWVTEYARQARLFAEKFVHEESRAAMALIDAGTRCERAELADEAKHCYQLINDLFPNSIFAQQIAANLRRLQLPGQFATHLKGPTLDGGFFNLEQYAGKTILVYFWASNSEEFHAVAPRLAELEQMYGKNRLAAVGVNLDQAESAVDAFLEEHSLPHPQIFFSPLEQRGSRNPVARYYGVRDVPEIWLIGADGHVMATGLSLEEAERTLQASS